MKHKIKAKNLRSGAIIELMIFSGEKVELATYDLGDLVVNMTYAYTKKGNLRTEEVSKKINRLGKDVAEDIAKEFKKD